jgi:hypothetical protein
MTAPFAAAAASMLAGLALPTATTATSLALAAAAAAAGSSAPPRAQPLALQAAPPSNEALALAMELFPNESPDALSAALNRGASMEQVVDLVLSGRLVQASPPPASRTQPASTHSQPLRVDAPQGETVSTDAKSTNRSPATTTTTTTTTTTSADRLLPPQEHAPASVGHSVVEAVPRSERCGRGNDCPWREDKDEAWVSVDGGDGLEARAVRLEELAASAALRAAQVFHFPLFFKDLFVWPSSFFYDTCRALFLKVVPPTFP